MSKPSRAEMPLPPFAATTSNAPGQEAAGALRRSRRISVRDPEWWIVAAAVAAWAFLATGSHANARHGEIRGQVAALAAMVVAMMLPLTIGRVRGLTQSRTSPAHRAAVAFVIGYLAVWMLAMFAIDAAWRLGVSRMGWTAAVGLVIAAAALWEVAPAQWRGSARCDDVATHHAGGKEPASASAAWSGVTAGGGCVASCWALMAACVAFAHSLPVMAALFAIQLYGRYRRPASAALTALAVLGVCLASLALRMGGHHHHPGT